jgi:hypothetical protein
MMAPTQLQDFTRLCDEQDVGLEPVFLKSASSTEGIALAYAPSEMFRAVAAVSKVLRENPGARLAQRQIDTTPPAVADDVATATLADLINDSVQPVEATVYKLGTESIGTCPSAETKFGGTLIGLAEDRARDHAGCEVFVDGEKPVLLRKRWGIKSSLVVGDDVVAGGFRIRPLSIVRAETHDDRDTGHFSPNIPTTGLRVRPMSDIASIAPVRLSLFAVPPHQRDRLPLSNSTYLGGLDEALATQAGTSVPAEIVIRAMNNPHQRITS